MRLLQYRAILLVGLLVLLSGAGFLGWHLKGFVVKSQEQTIAKKLADCEYDQQVAIKGAQDATVWLRIADEQIGQLRNERKQLQQDYEDSLRIIRNMLPDRAERAIADYYEKRDGQKQHWRRINNDGSDSPVTTDSR